MPTGMYGASRLAAHEKLKVRTVHRGRHWRVMSGVGSWQYSGHQLVSVLDCRPIVFVNSRHNSLHESRWTLSMFEAPFTLYSSVRSTCLYPFCTSQAFTLCQFLLSFWILCVLVSGKYFLRGIFRVLHLFWVTLYLLLSSHYSFYAEAKYRVSIVIMVSLFGIFIPWLSLVLNHTVFLPNRRIHCYRLCRIIESKYDERIMLVTSCFLICLLVILDQFVFYIYVLNKLA